LSNIIYWDEPTLLEVDSELIKTNYRGVSNMMMILHKRVFETESSPYNDLGIDITFDEFLWAWSTVSTRGLSLNNS